MAATSVKHTKNQVSARQHLAINLVLLRRARGWSQEDLGFEAGLHRTFVAHVERGARNIALDNVEKLAEAFGVETYRLLMPPSGETR
jgi:transcriptional regulator with XRE-family HTH domain